MTNSCGFTPSEAYFSKEVYSKELKTYKVVKRNMIAFNPSRINVGSVALQDKADEVIVSPLYVVFSVDERRLLPEYVVRFLKSKPGLRQIAARSIGTVRNNLKYDALCRMEMNLPSLEDQQTQLAALSLVEKQISAQKAMISYLQSLVKSRFVEMFGDPKDSTRWKKAPLSTECKILTGNTPSRKCAENYGDLLEWVKTDNIRATGSIGPSSERLSTKGAEKARVVDKGAILMVCIAGSVKSIGRVGLTDRRLAFNQQINAIIPGPNYLPEYLLWAFKLSKDYLCCDINMQLKGILNKTTLSAKEYALPPLPLQREFAAFAGRAAKLEFVALVQYNNQCRFQFNEGRSHDNRRDKEQGR